MMRARSKDKKLLDLQRMEAALIRAWLEHPERIDERVYLELRYALGLARLTRFQPGAAGGGRACEGDEVAVAVDLVQPLRDLVHARLYQSLRLEKDAAARLAASARVMDYLRPRIAAARTAILERHADDFTVQELDAEVGIKTLVSVAGGGGGAGYVYLGAWEAMQEQGIVPGYVIGTSIGALLGAFRARQAGGDLEHYINFAKGLSRRDIFSRPPVKPSHGIPGMLGLHLGGLHREFSHADGTPMKMSEMGIPYDAVVGGVRKGVYDHVNKALEVDPTADRDRGFSRRLASRMWRLTAYFNPKVTREIVLGADELTREFNVVDAIGFSAAIPGVLHHEAAAGDERMRDLLDQLLLRHHLAGIVDGGVVNNVPVRTAWKQVQNGRIGTRNAWFLGFDSFHPSFDPRHVWLWPVTRAVQLQVGRNRPYADWMIRFDPTLAVLNLLPDGPQLDKARAWGRASVEDSMPQVREALRPVPWLGADPARKAA